MPSDAPAGFTRVEGFSERWDYVNETEIQGIWGAIQTVTVPVGRGKQEDRRYVDVTCADGRVLTVWESAALTRAFDTVPEGVEAVIQYRGEGEAKKGQNAPKLFNVYYKEF